MLARLSVKIIFLEVFFLTSKVAKKELKREQKRKNRERIQWCILCCTLLEQRERKTENDCGLPLNSLTKICRFLFFLTVASIFIRRVAFRDLLKEMSSAVEVHACVKVTFGVRCYISKMTIHVLSTCSAVLTSHRPSYRTTSTWTPTIVKWLPLDSERLWRETFAQGPAGARQGPGLWQELALLNAGGIPDALSSQQQ